MENGHISEKNYRIIKVLLIIVSLCALIIGVALLIAPLREFIIVYAEINILQRSINHHRWHDALMNQAITFFIIAILFFYAGLGRTFEKIMDIIRKIYLNAKKLVIPKSVFFFAALCLFLFFYVRLNINIMPFIVGWIIYRLGFAGWLIKLFGKKETKMALIISVISIIFFITVMLMFRLAIIMNLFWGDSNRVL